MHHLNGSTDSFNDTNERAPTQESSFLHKQSSSLLIELMVINSCFSGGYRFGTLGLGIPYDRIYNLHFFTTFST